MRQRYDKSRKESKIKLTYFSDTGLYKLRGGETIYTRSQVEKLETHGAVLDIMNERGQAEPLEAHTSSTEEKHHYPDEERAKKRVCRKCSKPTFIGSYFYCTLHYHAWLNNEAETHIDLKDF